MVAIADVILLPIESERQKAEGVELRRNRARGLNALTVVSLGAIGALLAWAGGDKASGRITIAHAGTLFALSAGVAGAASFAAWFEPSLRSQAPSRRFVIGPDDAGDYDDQASEYWQLQWVEENGSVAIPKAIRWRIFDAVLWISLSIAAALFASALFVGGREVWIAAKLLG